MSWTLPLADAATAGQAVAGGKAVRLGELIVQGFDVPPGFVVATEAFVRHLTEAGASLLLDGEYPTPEMLERAAAHPLDADLERAILDAYDALARDSEGEFVCAVRSSAADEDGTAASFAGQHATYYYTRRSDLARRIVDCWLSAFTLEARAYRRQLGLFAPPRMAVIVQYMVPSDIAGVTFTRDPTGQHPESIVIEACWGLGAALVDGRVSPDTYRVSRPNGRIESRRIGSKRFRVTQALLDPAGSRLETVPRYLQGESTLDDHKVAEVAELALACERAFGVAQDVEWAFSDDRLYLLQSRPVTRIAEPARRIDGRWVAFKPVLENSTAPFTPLTVDLVRRVVTPMFGFIDGRLYLDFDRVRQQIPVAGDDAALIDALLLRKPSLRLDLDLRRLGRAALVLVVGYLSAGVLLARTRSLPSSAFEDFAGRCRRILEDSTLDAPESLKAILLPRHPFAPIGELVLHANVSAVRYFVLLGFLERLLARLAPTLPPQTLAALTAGRGEMLSRNMLRDLQGLASIAAERPAVARLLRADHFDELPHQLAAHPDAGPFVEALAAFMDRYGHRGTREIELASPRWREDPTPLFAMIRNVLRDTASTPSLDSEGRRRAAEAVLETHLPGRLPRALVRYLCRRVAYFAGLRENTRHWHALGFATVRQKIQAVEQQLIADGRLKCADDVYYLHWDEILELQAGRSAWRHVEDRIRRRRIRHQRRSRQSPPLGFNIDVEPAHQGSLRLSGQCGSPGCAEGRARLMNDPAIDGLLVPGEILVAPFTDPTWTPLFLNASAVVVETGSYLSHAGTIARELGIPCLVDVAGVMDTLHNGQRLRVDATAGSVLLLDGPEEIG